MVPSLRPGSWAGTTSSPADSDRRPLALFPETERARFINDHTLTITLGSAHRVMQLADRRVTGDDIIESSEAYAAELTVLERHRRSVE